MNFRNFLKGGRGNLKTNSFDVKFHLQQKKSLFCNVLYPQTEEVHINKRLNKGSIEGGSTKIKTVKIVKIVDP